MLARRPDAFLLSPPPTKATTVEWSFTTTDAIFRSGDSHCPTALWLNGIADIRTTDKLVNAQDAPARITFPFVLGKQGRVGVELMDVPIDELNIAQSWPGPEPVEEVGGTVFGSSELEPGAPILGTLTVTGGWEEPDGGYWSVDATLAEFELN